MQGSENLSPRVARLAALVESRYGIDLTPYVNAPDHIEEVNNYYEEKRAFLRQTLGESAITHSADYARTYLISEAARMLLREIAPKRIKKRKG
jgi:hypothetical protein